MDRVGPFAPLGVITKWGQFDARQLRSLVERRRGIDPAQLQTLPRECLEALLDGLEA